MRTRTIGASLTSVLGAALALGCGSAPPPKQLVDARAAYSRAQRSQAPQLSPAELRQAKIALDAAEKQYEDDAKSGKVVDKAYIAQRKAELAEAQAATIDMRRQEQDLAMAQQQAAAKAAEEAKGELETTRGELEAERMARTEAEMQAAEALAKLEEAGTETRQDPRGTVIMLPGAAMFATGKSTLRPTSRAKLRKVADALEESGEQQILVEGHTDSTGSDEVNMELSQERADAVRDFLVTEGVPEDRITATGVGSARPIGDNSTAEGRAENRRVEIIVQNLDQQQQMQRQGQQQQEPMAPMPMPMP